MEYYLPQHPQAAKILKILAAFLAAAAVFVLVLNFGGRSVAKLEWLASLVTGVTPSREQILVIVSPQIVESGSVFSISWTHEGKSADGWYGLSYPCREGLTVTFASHEPLPCGKAFPFSAATPLSLLVSATGPEPVDVPFSVSFTPSGAPHESLAHSATVTVKPAAPARSLGAALPTAPAVGPATAHVYPLDGSGARYQILPNGTPDFSVQIIDVGIIDDLTGAFVATSSVGSGRQAAVVFDVSNIGTAVSEPWQFGAKLPTVGGDFTSEVQQSLAPGDRIRFTIGFQNLNQLGENTATFTVDPSEKLKDASRANNTATATVVRGY